MTAAMTAETGTVGLETTGLGTTGLAGEAGGVLAGAGLIRTAAELSEAQHLCDLLDGVLSLIEAGAFPLVLLGPVRARGLWEAGAGAHGCLVARIAGFYDAQAAL